MKWRVALARAISWMRGRKTRAIRQELTGQRLGAISPRVLLRHEGPHPELIGKELHYSAQPVMLMGLTDRGTTSGAPTIAVVIRRPDGTYTVAETTLRGLVKASQAFEAEYLSPPRTKLAAVATLLALLTVGCTQEQLTDAKQAHGAIVKARRDILEQCATAQASAELAEEARARACEAAGMLPPGESATLAREVCSAADASATTAEKQRASICGKVESLKL